MSIFKRRDQLSIIKKIIYFFWPSTGWRRACAYIMHRIGRFPGTPYSIASGFACGAAISFTPFVGLHFIISAIFAWVIRANLLASAIGTSVGNPWTFPFIWAWLYQTGNWLTEGVAPGEEIVPKFSEIFGRMMAALLSLDKTYLLESSATIFWPMLISSIPTGIVIWFLFFFPIKYAVGRYQHSRLNNLTKINRKRSF
jgi:uncharacterized protein (DUF2062 family)|tara:strand:- start:110 stop:703 length:594 start_codon:yes stop_codon:yes gene_type:complete